MRFMNSPTLTNSHPDIQGLAQAITLCKSPDALRCQFSPPHWELLGSLMQPFTLNSGQVLIEQKSPDRTLYFVESGNLSVHYEDEKDRVRMAMVGAGSVVGEGSFFSHQPRAASVHAAALCKLWSLTPIRFTELSNRHPTVALELTLALGSVMARRLSLRPRRIAIT